MTKEERQFYHDISAIRKALDNIAKDLRYFRKKDESAAVVEETKYTCKDCDHYQKIATLEPNKMAHWCTLHFCTISEEGLEKTCPSFIMEEDSNAAE